MTSAKIYGFQLSFNSLTVSVSSFSFLYDISNMQPWYVLQTPVIHQCWCIAHHTWNWGKYRKCGVCRGCPCFEEEELPTYESYRDECSADAEQTGCRSQAKRSSEQTGRGDSSKDDRRERWVQSVMQYQSLLVITLNIM